jgi:hypothetical protein
LLPEFAADAPVVGTGFDRPVPPKAFRGVVLSIVDDYAQ